MQLREAVPELQRNLREIRKQQMLRKLRKWLRPFLLGFFIGKNAEKRIRELESKNAVILAGIRNKFGEIEEHLSSIEQRIIEIRDTKLRLEGLECRIVDFSPTRRNHGRKGLIAYGCSY